MLGIVVDLAQHHDIRLPRRLDEGRQRVGLGRGLRISDVRQRGGQDRKAE